METAMNSAMTLLAFLPKWVSAVGMASGALGVSIAIWLQLVTRRRVDPVYVLSFLGCGVTLVLLNLDAVWGDAAGATIVRGAVYLALLGVEAYLGYRVWRESSEAPGSASNDSDWGWSW